MVLNGLDVQGKRNIIQDLKITVKSNKNMEKKYSPMMSQKIRLLKNVSMYCGLCKFIPHISCLFKIQTDTKFVI